MNGWQRIAQGTDASEIFPESNRSTPRQAPELVAIGPALKTPWVLNALLLTAPNVEKVIEIFTHEVNKRVACASYVYQNDEQGIVYSFGAPAKHSLTYRLAIGDKALGEMVVTREKKFLGSEISWIESQFSGLAYALRNSLLYHEAVTCTHFQWPRSATGKLA